MTPATSVPKWSALPGSPPSFVETKKVPMIDAMMPMPPMYSGMKMNWLAAAWAPAADARAMAAPMIIAPMIEPTYDSKRSAPMPATSPTLSPTLSAMVAGLRGSSSGMPASTLPTRSAPTSAAFV